MLDLHEKKVLVIGDIMLDEYIVGEVYRLAQEAPCTAFKQEGTIHCAGAAANVALMADSFDCRVTLTGYIGEDEAAEQIENIIKFRDIAYLPIITREPTIVKRRYCDDRTYHQVFRSDVENPNHYRPQDVERLLAVIRASTDADIIIISDYGKGVIERGVARTINELFDVFVGVDPYPANAKLYWDMPARLVTPNETEAKELSLHARARNARDWTTAEYVIITRGKRGVVAWDAAQQYDFDLPAKVEHPICVVGAGDIIVTVGSLMLQNGCNLWQATSIANEAAGIGVQKPYTSKITFKELEDCLTSILTS